MMKVPFFRPDLSSAEVDEVVAALRSGWLTTGPRVRRFEEDFASAVGGKHAVAVNSCTAALHLAVEALGLKAEEAVLVPAMTFAATAEVIRYLGAIPILVDCEPVTLNMDLEDAARKLEALARGRLPRPIPRGDRAVGIIPVHVGGWMMDTDAVASWARSRQLWVVEDAAHSFPAAWRKGADAAWKHCGEDTAVVSCFSFYANKTITTGEGGMAVTGRRSGWPGGCGDVASRALAGRLGPVLGGTEPGTIASSLPGYKYNMTDVAAAIGIHQLARAEAMKTRSGSRSRGAFLKRSATSRRSNFRWTARTGSTRGTSFPSGYGSTDS